MVKFKPGVLQIFGSQYDQSRVLKFVVVVVFVVFIPV